MSFNINLRRLEYSPDQNPLIQPAQVPVKKRMVKSGLASRTLIDGETGEVTATSVVHMIEEKDSDEFVKVFSAGIAATYELSATGRKVFQAVLNEYERTPMNRGFADSVYLAWMNDGLCGRSVGMSEKTFQRGLKELLSKNFLAPRTPMLFWVNPSLFFKGDRVMFVREFRRRSRAAERDVREVERKSSQDKLDLE